jgi:hypothetical protein
MAKAARFPIKSEVWITEEMHERLERLDRLNLGDDISGPITRPDHLRQAYDMYLTFRGIPAAPRPRVNGEHREAV